MCQYATLATVWQHKKASNPCLDRPQATELESVTSAFSPWMWNIALTNCNVMLVSKLD